MPGLLVLGSGAALAVAWLVSGVFRRPRRPWRLVPAAGVVAAWTGEQFAAALRHDLDCADYNPNLRQLLHVSYKVAAEMGERFFGALAAGEETIAENVRTNLLRRHILKVFPA